MLPRLKEIWEPIFLKNKYELLISTCSLIEAKWKALRNFAKSGDLTFLTRANNALESFKASRYFTLVDSWFFRDICENSDELYRKGHPDYMDCWIAGTAKAREAVLITEDLPLKKIIALLPGWKSVSILSWTEFLAQIT